MGMSYCHIVSKKIFLIDIITTIYELIQGLAYLSISNENNNKIKLLKPVLMCQYKNSK